MIYKIQAQRLNTLKQAKGYVMFLWHNHQPPLVSPGTKLQLQPYVRFHALRGYCDMPLWAKESGIKVAFNLTPSLMEQLELYTKGGTDPFLEHTLINAKKLSTEQKQFILNNFFKTDFNLSISPYPRYRELLTMKNRSRGTLTDFNFQDFLDLQVWFNLSMFGYGLRNENQEIKGLIEKDRNFTEADKRKIINLQIKIIQGVLKNYRRLQEEGSISITVSPYVHPIIPLIVDQRIALEGMPGANLPQFSHPDDARAQFHLAGKIYERILGKPPLGMWPSEGSVCMEMFPLISEALPTIEYLFTDADIRTKSDPPPESWWQKFVPWQIDKYRIFFRDRGLSDNIGFVQPERFFETAQDIYGNVIKIIEDSELFGLKQKVIIPLVLDGENLQPSRPNDAYEFIHNLYSHFSRDERIAAILPEEYLSLFPETLRLKRLFPGSWIGANFSTWTGDYKQSKGYRRIHRAENLLNDLKLKVELHYSPRQRETALEEIYSIAEKDNLFDAYSFLSPLARAILLCLQAESSCFRWWFGEKQGKTSDFRTFDQQFRALLAQGYGELGMEVPKQLGASLYEIFKKI